MNCGWLGVMVVTVGKQHVYVWQGFYYYEPVWELVAAGVRYFQPYCAPGSGQRATPSNKLYFIFSCNLW